MRRGVITGRTVAALLGLRTLLAFGVALAAWLLMLVLGRRDPVTAAAEWWIVTATLVDLGCLAALGVAARRERISLADLIGYRGRRDLLWLPVVALILAPGLAASSFLTSLAYPPAAPPEIVVVNVPPLAALYAVVVWPVIWTVTEEILYLGYALPRLEALVGKVAGIALVLTFWSLQHLALPLLPDAGYLLHRAVTPLPIVGAMTLAYFLVGRRLLPLIVVHWLGDLSTALLAVSSPL